MALSSTILEHCDILAHYEPLLGPLSAIWNILDTFWSNFFTLITPLMSIPLLSPKTIDLVKVWWWAICGSFVSCRHCRRMYVSAETIKYSYASSDKTSHMCLLSFLSLPYFLLFFFEIFLILWIRQATKWQSVQKRKKRCKQIDYSIKIWLVQ